MVTRTEAGLLTSVPWSPNSAVPAVPAVTVTACLSTRVAVHLAACCQTSPGKALPPSRLCPLHLLPRAPCRYWTSSLWAPSSHAAASYAVSVRQASALLPASFRSRLATANRPRCRAGGGLAATDCSPPSESPCWAHNKRPSRGKPLDGLKLLTGAGVTAAIRRGESRLRSEWLPGCAHRRYQHTRASPTRGRSSQV